MSKRKTAFGIGWLTALLIGGALMTMPWPSVSAAGASQIAEVVEATEGRTGAPIGVLWRGVAVLGAGAVVSTAAYAAAMKRNQTRAGSRDMVCSEMATVDEALENIETLAEQGSDKAAHVLKEWLKERTHT